MNTKKISTLIIILSTAWTIAQAARLDPIITKTPVKGSFPIVYGESLPTILLSGNEWPGVTRAAKNLQTDLGKVSGKNPLLQVDRPARMAIIIGTIGHSKLIDDLISYGKINISGVAGKWESTLIQTVYHPMAGVDSALVIAGSDKRGTIYGIYELSYQIGVSPWYYWADVPVKTSSSLHIIPGRHTINSPAVKYRGIFLNDEAPALSGWSKKEFGGFNHKFYEKVFELILRLRGNYLWPAMWGSAFNDDDPMNPILADEFGVVMGTSHHEPLSRAHSEWRRYKGGKWNYEQNPEQLRAFWQSGMERITDKEQIITVGMRGDGDEPMTQGTATELLEKIVKDQRQIIEKVTKKPAASTPQLWALYKEVQDYYDKGMRVPDDITLLLCDDNWGNIRRLPKLGEAPRSGGYGIYYHFDYVGGPRNYKWLNTNPIQKIWEQMSLAHAYDANQIWIVNVGDLKPMEFPIEFFLDYAWAPDAIPAEKLKSYTINWANKQFGSEYGVATAQLIDTYLKYSGRIKPELLGPNTYSLVNYREFETVSQDFIELLQKAKAMYTEQPAQNRDSYYQLVVHPIEALANLYELYFTVAKNRLYAKQGRQSANILAKKAESLFKKDAEITHYYNKVLAGGKWDHMMDQTHIGYTSWQQPERNVMPQTLLVENKPAALGLAIEGSENSWTGKTKLEETLPKFTALTDKKYFIDLFNKGTGRLSYSIKAPDFIQLESKDGAISSDKRIHVGINWVKAPKGNSTGEIVISGSDGSKIQLALQLENMPTSLPVPNLFLPENGYISMEATDFTNAVNNRPIFWKEIPGYGKTKGGMTTLPFTSPAQQLSSHTPHLQYNIYADRTGTFDLHTYISPTIDFTGEDGLKFAVSIDEQPPVTVNISKDFKSDAAWGLSVVNSIKVFKTPLSINTNGKHTIRYWMVSPGVVLQKLVLDMGGIKPSFLGPPPSALSKGK